MCTFKITSPMQLGGVAYHIGTHEAELKRDWFVDEMERVGMLTIVEGEAPRDANEVIIEAEQMPEEAPSKRGRKKSDDEVAEAVVPEEAPAE